MTACGTVTAREAVRVARRSDGADMTRTRHDLDLLVSVGLLATAISTILTGIIADLWDLTDFWYHTLAGYLMTAFAFAHVWLNRGRLVGYARFRWRTIREGPTPAARAANAARQDAGRQSPTSAVDQLASWRTRLVSRRGVLGLAMGAGLGLVVGRGLRPPPLIAQGSDLGVVYHEWSKPGIIDVFGTVTDWGPSVPLYKRYPGAPVIPLPEIAAATLATGPSTAETIATRRSIRAFADRPMTLDELSRLLLLTGGVTADLHGNARRAAPSSGALYPIELYAVVHRVDGLERGIYHYAVEGHALEEIRVGDFRAPVVEQGLAQTFLGEAGIVLFVTQILQRMRPRYQDRSYRYGLLEAGHIGENAYLTAGSMGLGACGVGAFMDDAINDMLGVDGAEEAVVYMLAVGRPA